MPYLTREEYTGLTGLEPPEKFDFYLQRASGEIDSLTRFFYAYHDLESDMEWRRKQFKRALAMQVMFYDEVGTTSTETLNNQPDSVRVGDTTVTYNRTIGQSDANRRSSSISIDAYNLLASTGLLYRGGRGYGI